MVADGSSSIPVALGICLNSSVQQKIVPLLNKQVDEVQLGLLFLSSLFFAAEKHGFVALGWHMADLGGNEQLAQDLERSLSDPFDTGDDLCTYGGSGRDRDGSGSGSGQNANDWQLRLSPSENFSDERVRGNVAN